MLEYLDDCTKNPEIVERRRFFAQSTDRIGVIGAAELNKTNTFTMNKFFSFHSLKVPLFDSKFSNAYSHA